VTAVETPLAPAGFPERGGTEEKLAFLLRYAVLAPSGHNTQPWLFRVAGDAVELHADRARALPVVDPDDRALIVSCGAALLNLRIALRAFGYRDDAYELLPAPDDADLLARVGLVAGQEPSEDDRALLASIEARRTTRTAYDERELPAGLDGRLQDEAAREGAWLHVVRGDERETVATLIAEGDRAQMASKAFRRELAAWIHPNRSRAARGMRGYGFGFGDTMSLAGPLVIRALDTGSRQAAKDERMAMRSPLLAVLGTKDDAPGDWLAAGQTLERVLLRACAEGLTSSFLNQPVEVAGLRPRLAAAIGTDGHPQLVLRFGYGPTVRPSPREAVDEVVIG
jgi:nitroreductase